MTTATETTAQKYDRLASEFGGLRHVHPGERTGEQKARLGALAKELGAILATPPAGYELPKIAVDLMAHAREYGWLTSSQWSAPSYVGEPFVKVEVGRKLDEQEREQRRGDRWLYRLTWHSRDCAPGRVRLFGSGSASTPDYGSAEQHDAPSVKAIRAVIAANPGPRLEVVKPPLVGADLWRAVMVLAEDRCQCQGACGKGHLTPARKPGRCEHENGAYVKGVGRLKLLAIPRDPLLPWHEAAALPPARLIAFCRPCADGVRRAINRGVKAMPPQDEGLFAIDP